MIHMIVDDKVISLAGLNVCPACVVASSNAAHEKMAR